MTYAAVARFSSFTAGVFQTVFGLHDGASNYVLVQDNGDTSGDIHLFIRDAPAAEIDIPGPTAIPTDTWYFFAVTVNAAGTIARFYWAQLGALSLTSDSDAYDPIYANSPDLVIGNSAPSVDGEFINGDVAWYKQWTRELTGDELLAEYFAGPRVVDHANIWTWLGVMGGVTVGRDYSGNGNDFTEGGTLTVEDNPSGPQPFGYWHEEEAHEEDLSPTGLTLTELAGPKVRVAFTDSTAGTRQHRVYRKTTGAYVPVATLDPGDTDWDDLGVSDGETYTYQVCVLDLGLPTDWCASDTIALIGDFTITGAITVTAAVNSWPHYQAQHIHPASDVSAGSWTRADPLGASLWVAVDRGPGVPPAGGFATWDHLWDPPATGDTMVVRMETPASIPPTGKGVLHVWHGRDHDTFEGQDLFARLRLYEDFGGAGQALIADSGVFEVPVGSGQGQVWALDPDTRLVLTPLEFDCATVTDWTKLDVAVSYGDTVGIT
jgi:hypothetical protein